MANESECKLRQIARKLIDYREAGKTQNLDTALDLNEVDGQAVQNEMAQLRVENGDCVIGYKIGATNQMARDVLGVESPVSGRLFKSTSTYSGRSIAATEIFQAWEVEIAVRLAHDLDPSDAPFTAYDIEKASESLVPAIEIVGSVFKPFYDAGATRMVADNASHGHFVFGDAIFDWTDRDFLECEMTLSLDDTIVASGKPMNVDGGPFGSTAWLANALAAVGLGLKAGDFVTTGTVTPIVPFGACSHAVADLGPLGRVRILIS